MNINIEKLILGTVQLGLPYGVNNVVGQPDIKQSFDILNTAYHGGIRHLDTARGYGTSMEVIGKWHLQTENRFNVINKFGHSEGDFDLSSMINDDLQLLHTNKLSCYMYHRAHLLSDKLLRKSLIDAKAKGLIDKVGVSIYTTAELKESILSQWIDVIQLPFNLLDNIAQKRDLLKEAKENGKELHVRSVFLQGLFFMRLENLPIHLEPLRPYLEQVHNIAHRANMDMASLALSYALSQSYIDYVLIGVETKEQLEVHLKNSKVILDPKIIAEIDRIKVSDHNLLNPSLWARA